MLDSFQSKNSFMVTNHEFKYFSLSAVTNLGDIHRLPFSLKILLENLLRHEDGRKVHYKDIHALTDWLKSRKSNHEIAFHPARVLMQDFTGVPAVVDLAAMRNAIVKNQGDPMHINPSCPVALIIDHSVQVDRFGQADAYAKNVQIEMERNYERYTFLKWGQNAFQNFQLVPPGTGICHQVNLEHLAKGVWTKTMDGHPVAFPDTLVGTDSHTTMINGLGVLGWGVGGIEAEAAMLGQPISMLIPEVVGFYLTGELREGITATDLVLTITQMLRIKGVVGKFVEFFGPGIKQLSVADRATISNMAPEYGATCGLFPIDSETVKYLHLTNREAQADLVEVYMRLQGMWYDAEHPEPLFTDVVELDLSKVESSLAGPKRPQDRVPLSKIREATQQFMSSHNIDNQKAQSTQTVNHGDVVIAAITSCTNTSNPSVMLAAGLLAKKAVEKGLTIKPWVKASLAPGSKVVTDYLIAAGLMPYLEKLSFYLVGYGCTTCIGNSGPLSEEVTEEIQQNDLLVCAVLSGNRNFEGRIHPLVKANWLASPPLVVAYALAGTTCIDLNTEPLANNAQGEPIYLKDIWPAKKEIDEALLIIKEAMFDKEYAEVFVGTKDWQSIQVPKTETYDWPEDSTYIKHPPFLENMGKEPALIQEIKGAQILALLGDSVTTDHISPAGMIKSNSPAGQYLLEKGVPVADFNSYGARRGNHEVMVRGTFANIRLRNEMVPGKEGGYTICYAGPQHTTEMTIYDAAMCYQQEQVPLVIFAGKEYGTGSSRDWAAKGTLLLGVKAVIAESFERIHRSNLIGMGVMPLEFKNGANRNSLNLKGNEKIDLIGWQDQLTPGMDILMMITRQNGQTEEVVLRSRIDTQNEVEYFRHGGILPYVLRDILQKSSPPAPRGDVPVG